jgi:hypothetical protein
MCAGNGHLLRVEAFIIARRYTYMAGKYDRKPTTSCVRVNRDVERTVVRPGRPGQRSGYLQVVYPLPRATPV